MQMLVFLVAVAAAAASPLLRLSVRHRVTRSAAPRAAAEVVPNATNNDVEVLPNDVLFAHVVELAVGDSPQRASLLIDTGSPDTMVLFGTIDREKLYYGQGGHFPKSWDALVKYADNTFDLRLSKAGQQLSCESVAEQNKLWCGNEFLNWTCSGESDPCTIVDAYGDGSLRIGTVTRDTVHLPLPHSLVFMRAVRFGSGKLSAETDAAMGGILGLSPSDERSHLPSTLDQLKEQGAIGKRMFALCLADAPLFSDFGSAAAGDLVLGAPHDLTAEQLKANNNAEFTVPMFLNRTSPDDNGTFVPRYLIDVVSASVNGVKLPTPGAVALVDSGSVRTILPAPLYDAVAHLYRDLCSSALFKSGACGSMDQLFGSAGAGGRWLAYALPLKSADLEVFPPLVFDLGAGTVEIPWQRLFFPQDVNGANWYGIGLSRSPEQMLVLGNNLLRGVRAVFDVDSSTLTFATPNQCVPQRAYWLEIGVGASLLLVLIVFVIIIVSVCRRRRRATSTARVVRTEGDGEPAERAPLAAHDAEEREHMASLADGLSAADAAVENGV